MLRIFEAFKATERYRNDSVRFGAITDGPAHDHLVVIILRGSAKRSAAPAGRSKGGFSLGRLVMTPSESSEKNPSVVAKIFNQRRLEIAAGFVFAYRDEREVEGDDSIHAHSVCHARASRVARMRYADMIHASMKRAAYQRSPRAVPKSVR